MRRPTVGRSLGRLGGRAGSSLGGDPGRAICDRGPHCQVRNSRTPCRRCPQWSRDPQVGWVSHPRSRGGEAHSPRTPPWALIPPWPDRRRRRVTRRVQLQEQARPPWTTIGRRRAHGTSAWPAGHGLHLLGMDRARGAPLEGALLGRAMRWRLARFARRADRVHGDPSPSGLRIPAPLCRVTPRPDHRGDRAERGRIRSCLEDVLVSFFDMLMEWTGRRPYD